MNKTAHTPGAERAAEQIALDSPEATDANLGGMIARFAEIIDRETGCGDMLAALEAIARKARIAAQEQFSHDYQWQREFENLAGWADEAIKKGRGL